MTLDVARGRVVLFGGRTGSWPSTVLSGETWEWDGATWQQRTPTSAPAPRENHRMTFDGARDGAPSCTVATTRWSRRRKSGEWTVCNGPSV